MSSPNNYNLIFSSQAVEDLKDIVAYSLATWGEKQARKYNQQLKNAFAYIKQNPRIGHFHSQLPSKYLVYHVGRHFIIYMLDDTTIEIVRILHDKMDLSHHLN